jgi:hypothetical protein
MEDFVEEWPAVVQYVLKADESPRLVGRPIVIRRQLETKVGHQNRFSTKPWKPALRVVPSWRGDAAF